MTTGPVLSDITQQERDTSFVGRYGRKFSAFIVVVVVGFCVYIIAVRAGVAVPERVGDFKNMQDSFNDVLWIAVVAFAGADAAITWKHGGKPRGEVTEEERTITTKSVRQSGAVIEPPGGE